jgi:acyl-CoA thioesterase
MSAAMQPSEGALADDEAGDLAADTKAARAGQSLYTTNLPNTWSFVLPSGGVLMTIALRAMGEELADAGLRPMSATAIFCSRVPAGPLSIRVETLRRGNAAAQLRASVIPAGAPSESAGEGLEVSATFVRDRPGPEVLQAEMPVVPRPEDAEPFVEGRAPTARPLFPFFRNFDSRLGLGRPWWRGDWEPSPARFARWLRYRKKQARADGSLDPLAIPPIADTMPTALWTHLGPREPQYYAPSLDLTVHFLEDTASEWLLVRGYCRHARAGYATGENEIWSEDGRLIAFATQTMMLREVAPKPRKP